MLTYTNVHAAAGEDGIGEDDIGNYTDYWTYGSTSVSTPSEIQGDDSYITYCRQALNVPGKDYYLKFFRFEGAAFTGKAIYGKHRYYTENGDNVTVSADQSAVAYYTDENGQEDSVSHSHFSDIDVPPGGSSVNEIP